YTYIPIILRSFFRVQFLCCHLRSRDETNCTEEKYPKPNEDSPKTEISFGNKVINSLSIKDDFYQIRFCDLKQRDFGKFKYLLIYLSYILDQILKDEKKKPLNSSLTTTKTRAARPTAVTTTHSTATVVTAETSPSTPATNPTTTPTTTTPATTTLTTTTTATTTTIATTTTTTIATTTAATTTATDAATTTTIPTASSTVNTTTTDTTTITTTTAASPTVIPEAVNRDTASVTANVSSNIKRDVTYVSHSSPEPVQQQEELGSTIPYDPSKFYRTPTLRRSPSKEKILKFCTKDVAVRDINNLVIACGDDFEIWRPSRCPQKSECFFAEDSTYRICCPVAESASVIRPNRLL
ncbi:unnamed protein product, partial [Enterobius vermicularis]|uniref:Clip domain-containing protein n=1 Tax=Enterobius vermicularis TaxID=51028 RepID=A0A0N4V6D7_ENTVE